MTYRSDIGWAALHAVWGFVFVHYSHDIWSTVCGYISLTIALAYIAPVVIDHLGPIILKQPRKGLDQRSYWTPEEEGNQ